MEKQKIKKILTHLMFYALKLKYSKMVNVRVIIKKQPHKYLISNDKNKTYIQPKRILEQKKRKKKQKHKIYYYYGKYEKNYICVCLYVAYTSKTYFVGIYKIILYFINDKQELMCIIY